MDKDKGKLALKHLVDRYNSNKYLKDFISNEKQISRSLIEPFVRDVLGWDIEDPQEFKVEVPASGKRVDILVCLNGVTQFIVEAKSLTQDIVDNNDFYKQTISYAHSKEKTFAILTNFRHFIILRCDVEVDNPLKAAVKVINIENYTDDDFGLLYNFSREIWIGKGVENPLYLKLANFKRRAKVDVELLENLKEWRQSIINNINKHPRQNKYDFSDEKSKYEVEEEIQRFLDRIIFICYTEDKGFVDSELKSLIELKKDKHYESQSWLLDKIRSIFKKYWNDYNSDLFKLGKCDEFFIEDAVLLKILTDLRKPKDRLPYDFGSIEADILGKTYENFIGHVIAGEKRFKEKESKGKRKSEGIYYTPTYIVDYIVRNTVKEYIKGKSLASINKVKILDPACGSGSFLIKAFDALADESKNILKRDLNYEEKKNLMLNCIFGVDKDERAVDICKLNLSLKLAERGQKLPPLHDNIKCGDSLIDDKEIAGYKAFKWEDEFKEIMGNGGFDVVIGNPPYISNWQLSETDRLMVEYLDKKYLDITLGHWDIYVIFIQKCLDLLNNSGFISFIVPSSFSKEKYGRDLRKRVIENFSIISLADFNTESVFKDVARQYVVFVIQNKYVNNLKTQIVSFKNFEFKKSHTIFQKTFSNFHNFTFRTDVDERQFRILKKISEESVYLGEILCVNVGVVAHSKEGKRKSFTKDDVISDKYKDGFKKYIEGKDISRYSYNWKELYIDYVSNIKHFHRPKFPELFENNKIIVRRISGENNSLIAIYDDNKFYSNDNLIILIPWSDDIIKLQSPEKKYNLFKPYNYFSLKYILTILNSRLISFYFSKMVATGTLQGTYSGVYPEDMRFIPIIKISQDKQLHFIKLADKMLSLNKKLQEFGDKSTLEKQKIEEEIKKTDNEIDELVYQLYGITEEEKKIIEEGLR